jgi:YD repeat-containing protein
LEACRRQLLFACALATAAAVLLAGARPAVALHDQGRLTSIRDRNGKGSSLTYGGDGRASSLTDSAGRVMNFTYSAEGRLASLSLPGGRSVSYGYTSGRLTSVTDLRGGTTTYAYDGSGRLMTITDQNGHAVVRNTYGSDGRVIEQLDALANRTAFSWDPDTLTATATDARGKQWKDRYSGNVLQSRTDPLGNVTTYTYDPDLNLTAVRDGRGNMTSMTFSLFILFAGWPIESTASGVALLIAGLGGLVGANAFARGDFEKRKQPR